MRVSQRGKEGLIAGLGYGMERKVMTERVDL